MLKPLHFMPARLRFVLAVIALVGVWGASAVAMADDATRVIAQRMKTADILRGQFVQEKYFSIMKQPLKSTGTFTMHHEKGIWWHNDTPIPGDLILSDTGILQRSHNGSTQRHASSQQPALKLMTDIIRQLVSGDWQQLSKHFDITATASAENANVTTDEWSATLTPKPGSLFDSYAQSVELKGGAYVSFIAIYEKSGDKTRIEFSELSSDTQLQPRETDAFAW